VTEVTNKGVQTHSGRFIPSELVVWAAGIKAPDFLHEIDGLETNRINQLVVHRTLQTTVDANIFAFGDCAACPWVGHGNDATVPPRAQAAHQQASMLIKTVKQRIAGKKDFPEFTYRDYGSLVNLGAYTTVGNLMGALSGGSLFIEGLDCTHHVPLFIQTALDGATWFLEYRIANDCPHHYAAHRGARQAALIVDGCITTGY